MLDPFTTLPPISLIVMPTGTDDDMICHIVSEGIGFENVILSLSILIENVLFVLSQ